MDGKRSFASIALLLAGLSLASAADLEAQETRRGFWIGFGFGGGWSGSEFLSDNSLRGGAFYLRAGGTVSQHFLFGGEVQSWFRNSNSRTFTRVNTNATALVYPEVDLGLFFKGGFGIASYQDEGINRTGVGTVFGAGYDVRLGDNFYLTPNADLMLQFLNEFTQPSFVFSLGLTWH